MLSKGIADGRSMGLALEGCQSHSYFVTAVTMPGPILSRRDTSHGIRDDATFTRSRGIFVSVMLALGVTLTWSIAEAQYFGRNKVQYRQFTFEVLKTEHFDIYFYPQERDAAGHAARMAERWYSRLSRLLGQDLRGRQPVILYASHPDFEQTNAISGMIDEGIGGVTEALKRRVILPLGGTLAETDHVLGHELVHAFQYDVASRGTRQPRGSSLERLPLWFIEGMAEYLSIGPVDPHTRCGFAMRPVRRSCQRSIASMIPVSSRTGGATRCGRTSPGGAATMPSAACTVRHWSPGVRFARSRWLSGCQPRICRVNGAKPSGPSTTRP